MTSRPPSRPPELPGYRYESLLGSGGYSDVFLYQQLRPRRRVAIKVLLSDVQDPAVHRQFEAEADVMAALSSHPSIVTIHQADVSSVGRPFIVMEYCSRPNYGARFRTDRIAVPEVLRVGIQVAGAVETAHRAGILHRDIKPANILVTDYDRAALTDFGISIAASHGEDIEDTTGMSIPWSPPEAFADPPRADPRSDVFSLGATLYTLLAGRTPFEEPGSRNSAADLVQRIRRQPLHPIDRPDIPPSLARAISTAMAKSPAERFPSALDLGRALQQVEAELSLPVTSMDILEERGVAHPESSPSAAEAPHTRVRAVTTPRSPREAPAAASSPARSTAPPPTAGRPADPRPAAAQPAAPQPAAGQPVPAQAAASQPAAPQPSAPRPSADEQKPAADPYLGVAAPRGGSASPADARAARRHSEPSEGEATVIRPAGAIPAAAPGAASARPAPAGGRTPAGRGSAASPNGWGQGGSTAVRPASASASASTATGESRESERRRPRIPPWLVLSVIGVLILGLGIGSVLVVRHLFVVEEKGPPTVAPSTAVVHDQPLGKPGEVAITVLDVPGAPVDKARITWKAPEGFTARDHYEVAWDVQGADYAVYSAVKIVRGRESTVRDMPPPAAGPQACVKVTAVREDGTAGESERVCTG